MRSVIRAASRGKFINFTMPRRVSDIYEIEALGGAGMTAMAIPPRCYCMPNGRGSDGLRA